MTKGTVIGQYRSHAKAHPYDPAPHRRKARSMHLTAVLIGNRVHFQGGLYGSHSVGADDPQRVNAHWRGYCANSNGGRASPVRISARCLHNVVEQR